MKYEPVTATAPAATRGRRSSMLQSRSESARPQQGESLEKVGEKLQQQKESRVVTNFPIEAFPKRIQNIITCFYECYRLPVDYHAASILTTASVAIGNGYAAYYKRRQVYPAILYTAVVGFPSSGKSPGIEFGTYPLEEIERKYREQYQVLLEEWKEKAFKASLSGDPEPDQPVSKDVIIKDATMESINGIMMRNPKGLLLYQDELKAWINNMNSYRKGSDLESWLSNWSGKSVKVSRSGKDPIWIPYPFISTIGGIQPGILHELANNGKADNGFLARILFAYPDEMECPPETNQEPDQSVIDLYTGFINFLDKLPNHIEVDETGAYKFNRLQRIEIPLSEEAKVRYIQFLNDYSEQMNETDEEAIKGILGKLKQYCLRISLILEMLQLAEQFAPESTDVPEELDKADWSNWSIPDLEDVEKVQISLQSLENAILMTEYFRKTAYKVVERLESPAKQLPTYQSFLYEQLPNEFDSALAREIAKKMREEDEKCKLSDRTVYRMLNDTNLFRQFGNRYQKTWLG